MFICDVILRASMRTSTSSSPFSTWKKKINNVWTIVTASVAQHGYNPSVNNGLDSIQQNPTRFTSASDDLLSCKFNPFLTAIWSGCNSVSGAIRIPWRHIHYHLLYLVAPRNVNTRAQYQLSCPSAGRILYLVDLVQELHVDSTFVFSIWFS